MTWSATQYSRFEDDRTRPVRDLIAAIPTPDASHVTDLGCGPGNSTELLCARYPTATATGIDTSADMLNAARRRLPGTAFTLADIANWVPEQKQDVILSNAALHWVPDHAALFPALLSALTPGGTLAVQMPDNMAEPSQHAMDETAAEGPWAAAIAAAAGFRAAMMTARGYIECLKPHARRVDVWRTTYMHVLPGGPPAIVEWFKGSGLRPFLAPLDQASQDEFLTRYLGRIEAAYPTLEDGSVVLPFPRLFIVATL